jgi:predicted Zn-dependent peptidase
MMKRRILMVLLICLLVPLAAEAKKKRVEGKIPGHPNELEYGELDFAVPDGDSYRHTLSNGIVVYVAEDRSLPLVNISIRVRAGDFLDTKPGVAGMTGTMLRRGGAGDLSPEEFDERADFLAANIGSFSSDTFSGASLNCISPVTDDALALFFDMLKSPRFDEERLGVEKGNMLENMKQRNDRPQSISGREWAWLMNGEHFSTTVLTQANLDALGQADLADFHKKYWRPANMTIGVSGDVDTKEILAKLEQHFAGWSPDGPEVAWPPAEPSHAPKPGVYYVEKDIPQGRVVIGHVGKKRDGWKDPDVAPLAVMNDILGGGGFTSRLVKRIRSDEGLAYSAGSSFGVGLHWPGAFQIGYQSKSPTVALAAQIALEEVNRIREEGVTDEELATAKASFIDVFPRSFESARDIVDIFSTSEYDGRPNEYWETYQDRIRAVTKEDVQRVAKKYLHPDQLVFLIVGSWEDIKPGDADGRASMEEFYGGQATPLPLRDPLTMEPMP